MNKRTSMWNFSSLICVVWATTGSQKWEKCDFFNKICRNFFIFFMTQWRKFSSLIHLFFTANMFLQVLKHFETIWTYSQNCRRGASDSLSLVRNPLKYSNVTKRRSGKKYFFCPEIDILLYFRHYSLNKS